jgi:outer membrane protein OmpA-like peptidoglycan-associated protein
MRRPWSLLCAGALAAWACAAEPDAPAGDGATAAEPAAGAAAVAAAPADAAASAALDWQDPEPPEAQALAEQVVDAEWNRDKTTGLEMSITTLVDTTTGIEGFSTALAAAETSLDDRLSRLGAEVTATEVTIRLPGSILFDFDKADIRPDAERTLAEVAEVLAAYGDRPARIEGHTDSIASDAYNLDLSRRRADSVKSWLQAHGVAAARLSTAGHGESQPVADNSTAAGRQQNRRVEIVIAKG